MSLNEHKKELVKTNFFYIIAYFEISVFDITIVDCVIKRKRSYFVSKSMQSINLSFGSIITYQIV